MQKKQKLIIIVSIAIAVILIYIAFLIKINKTEENVTKWNSVQELLSKYNCEYIKESSSNIENVKLDIYLKFGKNLYTENKSNERYFIDIISQLAKYKKYENFRLLDEEKKIEIIAIANEEKTALINIFINGDSNYFGNNYSKNSLENYEEETITQMNIVSKEINSLIENDWTRRDVNFGTRETIYNDYWNYFDEGIKVKTISGKVYNIIFTLNYNGDILEGISTKTAKENIVNKLGKPTFGSIDSSVFGYEGNSIYIFFADTEVSVYPKRNYETSGFIKAVSNLEEIKVSTLLDAITSIWNDYDKYIYNSEGYTLLRYSLKGVQIQFNLENNNGIVFYNNYNGQFGNNLTRTTLKEDKTKIPNGFFFADENLIYIAEKERADEESQIRLAESYKNLYNRQTEDFYFVMDKQNGLYKNLRVISKNKKYSDANVEVDATINSAMWLDNEQLAYSVSKKGIYVYNAKKYTKDIIVEGNKDYSITKYEGGKLYYD